MNRNVLAAVRPWHSPEPIACVRPRTRVTVAGVIERTVVSAAGSSPLLRCVLADETGELDLLFLGRSQITGLESGRRCTATGRAALHDGGLVIWNPRYTLEAGIPVPDMGVSPREIPILGCVGQRRRVTT